MKTARIQAAPLKLLLSDPANGELQLFNVCSELS